MNQQEKKDLVRKWLSNSALKPHYIDYLLAAYSVDYLIKWFDITDQELEELSN